MLVQGTDGNGKAPIFARALESTACVRYCRFGLVEDRVCAMCRVVGGVSNRAKEQGGRRFEGGDGGADWTELEWTGVERSGMNWDPRHATVITVTKVGGIHVSIAYLYPLRGSDISHLTQNSIVTISCLREQTLTRYSNTMNPTYDTLASGVWSNVKLNVGVICVCMPTFRPFFALILPRLCGSAEDNSSMYGDGQGPKNPSSSGNKISKKKNTLPDSLFASTIMKRDCRHTSLFYEARR